ncbi:MAG: hypothetical protein WKF80_09490, partial [Thermomicrobiales bacterium]
GVVEPVRVAGALRADPVLAVRGVGVDELPIVESQPMIGPPPSPGGIRGEADSFRVPASENAATTLITGALLAGARVHRLTGTDTSHLGSGKAGDFIVGDISRDDLDTIAVRAGIMLTAELASPDLPSVPLRYPRVAVIQTWRGSATDAGWTRFVLGRHGLETTVLRPADLRGRGVGNDFDAVIVASDSDRHLRDGLDPKHYPAEWAGGIDEACLVALRAFGEGGGTVIGLGEAVGVVIEAFDLPISNVAASLGKDLYAAPGAMVGFDIATSHPLARGFAPTGQAMHVGPVVLDLKREEDDGLTVAARYRRGQPVLAGWMRGGRRLAGTPAVVESQTDGGRAILIAFRPQFRGQTPVSYRWLFNAIWRSVVP